MHLPKVRRRTFSWIRSPCFLSNLWHILNVAFGVATNLSSSDYTRENAFNAMHSKRTLINATASLNRKKPNLHVKSRKKFAAKVSNSVNIHNFFLFLVTPQYQRRQGQDKTFFPGMYRPPHNYPTRPPSTNRPQRSQRPTFPNYPPTRPPYWSGGFFGFNQYRPPSQQYPSGKRNIRHKTTGKHSCVMSVCK